MKAYPIIGGPLDGTHATSEDLRNDPNGQGYLMYNGSYGRYTKEMLPSAIWIHRDSLQPAVSAKTGRPVK